MLRFFAPSRLAGNPDLYFEIASSESFEVVCNAFVATRCWQTGLFSAQFRKCCRAKWGGALRSVDYPSSCRTMAVGYQKW